MHLDPRSSSMRAQAAACVLAITAGLTVVPALVSTAGAATAPVVADPAACQAAKTSYAKSVKQRDNAKKALAKATAAVEKAKKSHAKPKARKAAVAKARKTRDKAATKYAATKRAVTAAKKKRDDDCAEILPVAQATAAGKKLGLLAIAKGLPVDSLDVSQLTALLDQLVPGLTDQLTAGELAALLGGVNAGSDLDPAEALALLTGLFSVDDVTAILGGTASPQQLLALGTSVVGQLSALGGLPVPGSPDLAGLWTTFAGLFGTLGSDQLGSLLHLLTTSIGSGSAAFDVDQLTDLIDSLVPGISEQFDPSQLTAMLGGLNGGALSAATLTQLLGGQFSPAQIATVLGGTAPQDLVGAVISQVVAQLATAGTGGLELPGPLGTDAVTGLISSVTGLLGSITGGGTGPLPVVCGLIPLPLLCP